MDTIVRPHPGAGWRIEFPRVNGNFTVVVADQRMALQLAARMRPEANVRLLTAHARVMYPSVLEPAFDPSF
jgi:class 3 adenylate cyclase